MSTPAVEVHDLVKIYRPRRGDAVRAVDGIDFSLEAGHIYGLLGPNGAGKTTLIKILSTLTLPTSGWARLLGVDVVEHPLVARRMLAAILQQHSVDIYLSVDANLVTYGRFQQLPLRTIRERMEKVLALFGLESYRNTRAVDLSVGFRRRLQVAKAFLSQSPLLFLDEMTTGMDPVVRRTCLQALREEVDRGRTVLLTTQNLQEAEELCNEIMIIDRGRIRARGTLETIRKMASRLVTLRLSFAGSEEPAVAHLKSLSPVRLECRNGSARVTLRGEGIRPLDVLNEVNARSPLTEFEVSGPSLEDMFLEFVGEPPAPGPPEEKA